MCTLYIILVSHYGILNIIHREHLSKIIVHPENSDIIWVASQGPLWSKGGDRGIYKTTDGGKTWAVIADGKSPGYRSCVQYIPNRNAKELVAVGFKGIDYSNDAGTNWKHLSDEGFYTIRFLNDSTAYAAGRGRISLLKFR